MKKKIAIIFALLYFLTTIGFSVNVHYCHGLVASCHKYNERDNHSCCDHKKEEPACCQNVTYIFQDISQEKIFESYGYYFKIPLTGIFKTYIFSDVLIVPFDETIQIYSYFSPPKKQPIWLLNCSFTLYG